MKDKTVKIVLISDYFLKDLAFGGGAEYNDEIINDLLINKGYSVIRKKSHQADVKFLSSLPDGTKLIVSNFINLSEESKQYIAKNLDYIIYEHDHKYLRLRIPSLFYNFKAPDHEIANYNFYKSAKTVLAQTSFHKKIIDLNIDTENVISLSGNLWTDEDFEQFKENLSMAKTEQCSVLNSPLINKGTAKAVKHCEENSIDYELIADKNYYKFLKKIASNQKLIFLPTIPETLSRICVEAKMMGCSVITNGMVGAKYEDWYKLRGEELIEHMKKTRDEIVELILEQLSG